MPLFESLNDDQIALLGCAVALFLCGGGMVLSVTLRRWITGTKAAGTVRVNAETPADPQIAAAADPNRKAA